MTSRLALVAAAAMLFGAYSANAADLGGGCCADLEERVAELEATTARKGNRVVSLQVYGLVSRGILVWDAEDGGDGGDSDSDTSLIDEDGSLFGLRGSASLKPGWTAGYRMEFSVGGEEADTAATADDEDAVTIDRNELWIESEQLGRVTLGIGSVATDGIAHIVLANTWSNSAAFQNDLYGITLGSYGNFDGGRGDRIRYDSPSIYGFILSASWSDDLSVASTSPIPAADSEFDEVWDVTLRYSGEFNAFRVAAGIGYTEQTDTFDILQGSASVMHVPTGLFASFSAGEKDFDSGLNQDYWYVNGGIEKTWLSYGATTIYAEYGQYDDGADPDTMWGAGLVQKFDSAALDIYLQYRHVEEDDALSDEFDTFLLGTSIAF